jgi:DNA-binding Xre family transcriptional regulator
MTAPAFHPADLAAFDADPSRGYWDGMGQASLGSTLGLRLRRERFRADRSLSDVAKRAGIAKSYLKKIEDGDVANPGIATLAALCRTLSYPLESLVGGLGPQAPAPGGGG